MRYDVTRASPTTVVALSNVVSFLSTRITIVILIVICVIGSVSSRQEEEIIQLKIEKMIFDLGFSDSAVRAGGS